MIFNKKEKKMHVKEGKQVNDQYLEMILSDDDNNHTCVVFMCFFT